MAVLALTLAGQAAGAAIGGSILGISAATIGGTVGMAIGQHFFGPKPQDQFGPRVRNLDSTTASEGEPIPIMWGSMRLPGTIIWAPKKDEIARTQEVGGKGSQSANSTTYYAKASWCVSFGYNRENIARSLRRVWANKELIYDATGEGEVTKEGVTFTFYDGTQTDPDPVMEASVGIGNVPAYTGQALLVFEDQSLEMWGNNHPTIEAELVDNATVTDTLSTLVVTSDYGYADGIALNNGHVWYDPYRELVWISFVAGNFGGTYGAFFVVNPYTGQVIDSFVNSATTEGSGYMYLCSYAQRYDRIMFRVNNTTVGIWDAANFQLLGYATTGPTAGITSNAISIFRGVIFSVSGGAMRYLQADAGETYDSLTLPTGYSTLTGGWSAATKTPSVNQLLERTPTDDEAHVFFRDSTDSFFSYFRITLPLGSEPQFTVVASAYASVPLSESISGTSLPDGGFIDQGVYVEETSSYWFPYTTSAPTSAAHLVEVDPDTGEVLNFYSLTGRLTGVSGNANWSIGNGNPSMRYDQKSRRLWMALDDGSGWFSIDSLNGEAVDEGQGGSCFYYHRSNGAAYGPAYEGVASTVTEIWKLNLNNIGQGRIAVASVVRDIVGRVASTAAASAVFSDVTASCVGAVADTQMPARNMINPLLQYAYADGFESEYVFKFVRRGSAVATALSSTYLGATTGDPSPTEVTMPHEIELPRATDVTFYNPDNNFQRGDVNYTWWSGRSDRKTNVQLPLAVTPQEALEHCTRLLHAAYNRVPYKVTAGPRYGQLEPTDVVSLPVNGRTERVRLEQIRRGKNGLRNMLFMADSEKDLEVYASAGGHNTRSDSIANNGSMNLFWLDLPLLQDNDAEHPGPYVAQYNYASGFRGGVLNTSPDNNAYTTIFSFDTEPAWGIVTNDPIAVGSIGSWDRDNTLSVNMVDGGGTLESTTSTAVFDSQANAVAYGRPGRWEILQYLSVSVASTGEYELSSLLRGRRGTDANIDSHSTGDFLVVLDENSLRRLQYAVADIGSPIYTRSTRIGQAYADVVPAVFSVTNHALKPYSPISVVVASAAGGDLAINWTSRTRANGSYVGLYDGVGPHGETTDEWQIDIVNAASGSVVVSGIATTSTNYLYASASQVSDGTNQQGTVSFRIFKISDSVGRGTPASVSYERPWPTGLKYALDLGADYVIPLNDAGSGTIADWYGSAVGVWGASTGVASAQYLGGTRYAAASVAADSSTSIGILGDTVHSWASGKTQATFAVWFDPSDWSGSETILWTPGNSTTGGHVFRINSTTVYADVTPNGSGAAISVNYSRATAEAHLPMFIVHTVDTVARTAKLYVNGVEEDSATWGTGHSGYAATLAWNTYASTGYPGRIGSLGNGTGNPFTGLANDVMLFPSVLSSTQVSTLFEKQNGHIERVTNLGGTHLWTLDQRTTKTSGQTDPDRIGSSDLFTHYAYNTSAVTNTARRSGDFGTTNYCRTALPANMKTQVFTFEGWFKLDTLQASAPVFAAFPVGAYASARGLYVEQDSTSLNVHYGPGDGTFRTITATVAAASTYHWAVVKASAAAPVLFVNGSAKVAGVSAFDIEWDDGTGAPPTATLYLSRANIARTADVSADVAGIDGKMGMIATYATALSSATIMESYLFGLKQL